MSHFGMDPIILLKGKYTVEGYYFKREEWPEATKEDFDEFEKFRSTLKALNEVGLIKSEKMTNDMIDAEYKLFKKSKELLRKDTSIIDSVDL